MAADKTNAIVVERMSIFSAYRLPGCDTDAIHPQVTPVNGTRAVVNCALGTDYAAIEDANYWVPPNFKGTTVDVAARLGR